MNCRGIQNQIRQPQGALSLSPEAQAHVAQCAECAREVKAARVQQLLLNALARSETPEPLTGFESRVFAKADGKHDASNGSTAALVGKLAWRLVPVLALAVMALVLLSGGAEPSTRNGLTTLVTETEAIGDGWGSEMAQMFSFEQMGGGAQ